ncbi:unnamed protein product [Schistosoma margrebowiei]|uniref:Uncharacterized protein n=1 Tax=Schistosoma margrebowiei TaxID=48269 RepID=A0A183MWI3_9TREM|nr:unnamed protein product [Schistosoma margrebowiei]
MLLYSSHGQQNVLHTQGVILIQSKEARKALVGWKYHASRIIKASFKYKQRNRNERYQILCTHQLKHRRR